MNPPTLEEIAAQLEQLLREIPMLTVHGVGFSVDTFIVYCRAKAHAEKRIPKKHHGFTVKYVLCKVLPAGASNVRR